jgi:uncharacterized membrane protein YeaQ/YmgE (transglycosylase-associated protein family)
VLLHRWWSSSEGKPLQEILREVSAYIQENPILSLGVAFVAGFAADKTVAYERRSSILFFLVVGLIGFFLSQFMLLLFGLKDYLEKVSEFRILFDFIAAYIGSFIVAAVIHFVKPT